jgi:hypothetical protein
VRAVLLLVVAGAAAFAACGAGAATRPPTIRFGLTGGNIAGSTVSIRPTGRIMIRGPSGITHRKVAARRVRRLRREIQAAHLAPNRVCAETIPDIASRYIRLGSHRFTLRGTCEPRFDRVWNDLQRAVGPLPR